FKGGTQSGRSSTEDWEHPAAAGPGLSTMSHPQWIILRSWRTKGLILIWTRSSSLAILLADISLCGSRHETRTLTFAPRASCRLLQLDLPQFPTSLAPTRFTQEMVQSTSSWEVDHPMFRNAIRLPHRSSCCPLAQNN